MADDQADPEALLGHRKVFRFSDVILLAKSPQLALHNARAFAEFQFVVLMVTHEAAQAVNAINAAKGMKNARKKAGSTLGAKAEDAAEQGLKKVPNPNGKKGGAAHQGKINDVEKDITNRELVPEREHRVDTPNGETSKRYVDVIGKDPQTGEMDPGHIALRGLPANVGLIGTNLPIFPIRRDARLRAAIFNRRDTTPRRRFEPPSTVGWAESSSATVGEHLVWNAPCHVPEPYSQDLNPSSSPARWPSRRFHDHDILKW